MTSCFRIDLDYANAVIKDELTGAHADAFARVEHRLCAEAQGSQPADLLNILVDIFGIKDLIITKSEKLNMACGLNGRPLLKVMAHDKNLAVLKIFRPKLGSGAKELWALLQAQKYQLPAPMVLALFNLSYEGEPALALLLDFVEGRSLNDLVADHIAMAASSSPRANNLSYLAHIFMKAGQGFALWHSKNIIFDAKRPNTFEALRNINASQKMLKISLSYKFATQPELDLLRQEIEHQLTLLENSPPIFSHIHGDAHLGNIVYDEAKDQIAFFDLEDGAYSYAYDQSPMAHPYNDYAKFVGSLTMRKNFGLEHEELSELLKAFDEGFMSLGLAKPIGLQRDQFLLVEIICYAAWLYDHEANLPKDLLAPMQTIFRSGWQWCQEIIEKQSTKKPAHKRRSAVPL